MRTVPPPTVDMANDPGAENFVFDEILSALFRRNRRKQAVAMENGSNKEIKKLKWHGRFTRRSGNKVLRSPAR